MAEDYDDGAIRWAQRTIWLDEDPRGIRMLLRGVGLRGGLRFHRDIPVRCLGRAGTMTDGYGRYRLLRPSITRERRAIATAPAAAPNPGLLYVGLGSTVTVLLADVSETFPSSSLTITVTV